MNWLRALCLCLLGCNFLGAPEAVFAGPYDPPPTYYDSATGTGATLKNQLHNIIDGHTVRSYNDARLSLQVTDRDPADPDRMILVYDRDSIDVSAINPNGPIPGWDSAATWNREHTWPRAHGVGSSGPDNSDLHQLRPSRTQVNSDRGNLNFGGVYGAQGFGVVTDKGSSVWYPGDADAGMIARQQFYMAVRYDNSDSSTDDLELVNGAPGIGGTTLGDLARLVEWHYQAAPDDFELRRNDVIYDSYQGNRNPFIDRPEYVWSVFVGQDNDSQISVNGSTVAGDGSSSLTVDFGRVLVGAPAPAHQQVTIDKLGDDGAYYQVSAAGDATSTLTGRYNAFHSIGAGATIFDVGMNTSTATAGQRTGTVTIDNLDVTTAGGSGRGANDGDDVVTVALDVLDHANPSFADASDLDMLSYDFGSVVMGDPLPTFDFDIYNLVGTSGFTASLDFDAISGSGDVSRFSTDLALFGGPSALAASESESFTVSLDTSVAGTFSAVYTLSFSDEDLPGAADLEDLQLTLTATVEESVVETADFDVDNDVDGTDWLTWQRGYMNGTTLSAGDANDDMTVDELDLAIWQQQYGGNPLLAGSLVVPEPMGRSSWLVGAMFIGFRRKSF